MVAEPTATTVIKASVAVANIAAAIVTLISVICHIFQLPFYQLTIPYKLTMGASAPQTGPKP